MTNIILGNKISDVVMVKGKIYSFLQTTSSLVTNPLSDVSGKFATCEDGYLSSIRIEKDQVIDVGTRIDTMNFIFTCLPGESAFLIVNSVTFEIANENDKFVWDNGGLGSHTFTTQYETISRTAGLSTFDVVVSDLEDLNFSLTNFS